MLAPPSLRPLIVALPFAAALLALPSEAAALPELRYKIGQSITSSDVGSTTSTLFSNWFVPALSAADTDPLSFGGPFVIGSNTNVFTTGAGSAFSSAVRSGFCGVSQAAAEMDTSQDYVIDGDRTKLVFSAEVANQHLYGGWGGCTSQIEHTAKESSNLAAKVPFVVTSFPATIDLVSSFGIYATGPLSPTGYIKGTWQLYFDENGNGEVDAGEPAIAARTYQVPIGSGDKVTTSVPVTKGPFVARFYVESYSRAAYTPPAGPAYSAAEDVNGSFGVTITLR